MTDYAHSKCNTAFRKKRFVLAFLPDPSTRTRTHTRRTWTRQNTCIPRSRRGHHTWTPGWIRKAIDTTRHPRPRSCRNPPRQPRRSTRSHPPRPRRRRSGRCCSRTRRPGNTGKKIFGKRGQVVSLEDPYAAKNKATHAWMIWFGGRVVDGQR